MSEPHWLLQNNTSSLQAWVSWMKQKSASLPLQNKNRAFLFSMSRIPLALTENIVIDINLKKKEQTSIEHRWTVSELRLKALRVYKGYSYFCSGCSSALCYFDVNKRFSTQIWLCQRWFDCSAFSLSFLCGKTHKQTSTVICQTFSFASPL